MTNVRPQKPDVFCSTPLKFSELDKALATNSVGTLAHLPSDRVLPMFHTGWIMFGGFKSANPAEIKNHTDVYAIGDIGYIELYSDGDHVQNGLIYFRADSTFVPLKSTNDFPARLEWEKNKFSALKSWFDKHLIPTGK